MTMQPALLALLLLLVGCDEMDPQKRDKPYGATALFRDGKVAQTPPDGTLARDDPALREALAQPPPMSQALLERGRQRYDIFCSPCHDFAGTGHGTVVARGFPQPESFHSDRLRAMGAREIVDVISQGRGAMFDFADRVAPADRWAIAAYIGALQLSQHAPLARLNAADRDALEAAHD